LIEIFKIHTRKMNLNKKVKLDELASQVDGASGADVKVICTEAGMFTIKEGRNKVAMRDFENAITKVRGRFEEGKGEAGVMYT
jgi:proteasome regulatory subunit